LFHRVWLLCHSWFMGCFDRNPPFSDCVSQPPHSQPPSGTHVPNRCLTEPTHPSPSAPKRAPTLLPLLLATISLAGLLVGCAGGNAQPTPRASYLQPRAFAASPSKAIPSPRTWLSCKSRQSNEKVLPPRPPGIKLGEQESLSNRSARLSCRGGKHTTFHTKLASNRNKKVALRGSGSV
jgi:hypothetical protein